MASASRSSKGLGRKSTSGQENWSVAVRVVVVSALGWQISTVTVNCQLPTAQMEFGPCGLDGLRVLRRLHADARDAPRFPSLERGIV